MKEKGKGGLILLFITSVVSLNIGVNRSPTQIKFPSSHHDPDSASVRSQYMENSQLSSMQSKLAHNIPSYLE